MTFISSFGMNLAEKGEGNYSYYEDNDGLYLVLNKCWPSSRRIVEVFFRSNKRTAGFGYGGWGILGPDRKHMTFCEKLFLYDSVSNKPYFYPAWIQSNSAIHEALLKVMPFALGF
jgi:hypothetical protein